MSGRWGRPDYKGRAIRELTGLVANIPVQNAESRRLAAMTGRDVALTDMDLRRFQKYEEPALQRREALEAEEFAKGNVQFNLNQMPGMDRADRIIFATRDHSTGGPMVDEYAQFVEKTRGVTFDDQGNAWMGDKPVTMRQAGGLFQDWALHSGVYQLPSKAIEADLLYHQDRVQNVNVSDEERAESAKRLEYLSKLTPKDALNQSYKHLESLFMTQSHLESHNIKMPYMDRAIQLAMMDIERLQGQVADQGDFDREQTLLKKQYDLMLRNAKITAGPGKPPSASQVKLNDERNYQHLLGQAQQAGIPIELDEVTGNVGGILDRDQFAYLQDLAANAGHRVYAREVTQEDTGVPFWPFDNETSEAYQIVSIVPTGDRQPRQPASAGPPRTTGPGRSGPPAGAQPTSPEMPQRPEGFPDNAVFNPQANRWEVEQDGQRFEVRPKANAQPTVKPADRRKVAKDFLKSGRQAPAAPEGDIPKTRADLRMGENIKKSAQKVDQALSTVGLGWENWKAAYGLSDKLWNAYSQFVNKIMTDELLLGSLFRPSQTGFNDPEAHARLQKMADDLAKDAQERQ